MAAVDSPHLRLSDGGIFKDSPIGQCLNVGKLNPPGAQNLPGTTTTVRHVFTGDEAFQLRPDFTRPLPDTRTQTEEVIYNYRLSRARTCVENAFGIMAKVTCMLHNFLCISTGAPTLYCPTGYADIEDTFGNFIIPPNTAFFFLASLKTQTTTNSSCCEEPPTSPASAAAPGQGRSAPGRKRKQSNGSTVEAMLLEFRETKKERADRSEKKKISLLDRLVTAIEKVAAGCDQKEKCRKN
ncbi:hypothetical protein HPB48_021339 [Haemaphysalis longicornis]|uniref:DDE Tnp4 domain-containing protein n=1 Tax=Haemaphysalis longicornis TaxID=44386 RepID=A0A9J6GQM4_HAELO|nr:hypothetical protein HPB48_021339 [Haemaphysalis longicornis]